jgi:hypothetical protein
VVSKFIDPKRAPFTNARDGRVKRRAAETTQLLRNCYALVALCGEKYGTLMDRVGFGASKGT